MFVVQYKKSVWKYLLLRTMGRFYKNLYFNRLSPTQLLEIPSPTLPSNKWVKIKTVLGSVCGSDLKIITCQGSPYFSPFTSFPFVLGHENVGIIAEVGAEVSQCSVGDRVVVEPMLHCEVRGVEEYCRSCKDGKYSFCENMTRGCISKGLQTGYCHDTGGSWGEYFVAHESQIHVLPSSISDEEAVLIEPFATALHAAVKYCPDPSERVLIYGSGSIGLLVLQALRALGCKNKVVLIVRYSHQADMAKMMGADHVLFSDRNLYAQVAEFTQAQIFVPELGKKVLVGGFDRTFDCVGSSTSIDDALRFTISAGTVVLVGMPGIAKGIDWTSAWYKELKVLGSYCYGWENLPKGQIKTFDLAIDLIKQKKVDLASFITHRFPIREYRSAMKMLLGSKEQTKVIKVAFSFS